MMIDRNIHKDKLTQEDPSNSSEDSVDIYLEQLDGLIYRGKNPQL
jgi:hypothetical protein